MTKSIGRPNQEERFYYLFQQLADKTVAAAKRFQQLVQNYEELNQAVAEIRLLEGDADALVHEVESRLNVARVTPFDREDIHCLAGRLDDIVDHIEATADRLLLFRIAAPTPHLAQFADTLARGAEEVRVAIVCFVKNDRESILHHCHAINEIENEADGVWRGAMGDLFSGETGALDVIKWKEIYDSIELAADACQDVSDVIESAALKAAYE